MATITKTYTENTHSGTASTWTFNFTDGNSDAILVENGSIQIKPNNDENETRHVASGIFLSGTTYTLPVESSSQLYNNPLPRTFLTQQFFNTYNQNNLTVAESIKLKLSAGWSYGGTDNNPTNFNSFVWEGTTALFNHTLSLNAPPDFTTTVLEHGALYSSLNPYTVIVKNLNAKYGGYTQKIKLTIGNQTIEITDINHDSWTKEEISEESAGSSSSSGSNSGSAATPATGDISSLIGQLSGLFSVGPSWVEEPLAYENEQGWTTFYHSLSGEAVVGTTYYHDKKDYELTTDTSVILGRSYYSRSEPRYEYEELEIEVEDAPNWNPSEDELYEYDETNNIYFLSTDTTFNLNKTYYIQNGPYYTYTLIQNPTGNPASQNWYIFTDEYILTITPNIPGNFIPEVTLTDSRGQTTTKQLNQITVNAYNKPSISYDIYRSNSTGMRSDEGSYGFIAATIIYTEDVANIGAPVLTIKDVGGQTITPTSIIWTKTAPPYSNTPTAISDWSTVESGEIIYALINGPFATTTSYTVTMTVTDTQNNQSQLITQTLSTAYYTIDFLAGGKEIAFGAPAREDVLYSLVSNISAPTWIANTYYKKIVDASTGNATYELLTSIPSDWSTNWDNYYILEHPDGLFNCAMDTKMNDMDSNEIDDFIDELNICGAPLNTNQSDWIIEQGTSGIWIYRKWNSGIAECWGTYSATISHYTTAFGGYGYNTGAVNFPTNLFVSAPICTFSAHIGNGFALTGTQTTSRSAVSNNYYAVSTASGSQSTNWYIQVKGRWK